MCYYITSYIPGFLIHPKPLNNGWKIGSNLPEFGIEGTFKTDTQSLITLRDMEVGNNTLREENSVFSSRSVIPALVITQSVMSPNLVSKKPIVTRSNHPTVSSKTSHRSAQTCHRIWCLLVICFVHAPCLLSPIAVQNLRHTKEKDEPEEWKEKGEYRKARECSKPAYNPYLERSSRHLRHSPSYFSRTLALTSGQNRLAMRLWERHRKFPLQCHRKFPSNHARQPHSDLLLTA